MYVLYLHAWHGALSYEYAVQHAMYTQQITLPKHIHLHMYAYRERGNT